MAQKGYIPEEWNLSYVINCYQGEGDALELCSYRGLKMLDQVLKIVAHVLENIIKDQIRIDSMQFGFMKGKGTTDTIFTVAQEVYWKGKRSLFHVCRPLTG